MGCSKRYIPPSLPVVLVIFMMACAQVGTTQYMGIYLEDIALSLGTTSTDIGVALGLFTAFTCFPAPIIAALYRLKSIRRLILVFGSFLVSLGVILTAFATDNVLMALCLSISGFGHCMVTMSSTIALDQHSSSDNFHLLYAAGMSGFGLGMVILPFLADILRDAYGWRGGLLVLGGLVSHLIPCAVAVQVGQQSSHNEATKYHPLSDFSKENCSSDKKYANDCIVEQKETVASFTQSSRSTLLHRNPERKVPPVISSTASDGTNKEREAMTTTKHILDRLLCGIRRSDFCMDPVSNLLFAAALVNGVMYCGWNAFLVPHVLQRGYSVRSTIIMNLYASLGNFLGRPLFGALSNRLTKPIVMYMGAALLNAFAILCDVFINQYYVMAVTTCFTAIGIAGMSVLGPLVVRERASPGAFDVAYAVNELFFGLGTFLGGYLSGLVGDIYSTYDATFKLLAIVNILVFLLMLPPFFIKKPSSN